jgi:transposase-like protein
MGHRKIVATVKAEAIRLVVEQDYSIPKAAQAMGLGPTALRRWVAQAQAIASAPPRNAAQKARDEARIKELEGIVRRLEEERDLLKKELPSHLKRFYRSPK